MIDLPGKSQGKHQKILIADDDQNDAEILSQLLKDNGYECLLAHNGIDALEASIKAVPDLIVLDVDMPGENGYEVARQLKAHKSTRMVPIIMLTALSELGAKLEGLEAGVDDYITKPFQHEEVLARVTTHLTLRNLQRECNSENAFHIPRMPVPPPVG